MTYYHLFHWSGDFLLIYVKDENKPDFNLSYETGNNFEFEDISEEDSDDDEIIEIHKKQEEYENSAEYLDYIDSDVYDDK